MFQPDISSNTRDRPKGSLGGCAHALAALDRMLSKECNQQVIFDALEKELQADPARFFRNTAVPLIPRADLSPPSSVLSLTCYLLLLIPFALKPAFILPTARPLQTLTRLTLPHFRTPAL